jgi:hypothetical protein
MNDNLYLIYCTALSLSGFIMAFYGIMARHKIELETRIGLNKGFKFDTHEGNKYFSEKYHNWRCGAIFHSEIALLLGLLIALTGTGLNLINNSWWTSILILFIAYIFYLVIVEIFKWKAQFLSLFALVISVILIIIRLM